MNPIIKPIAAVYSTADFYFFTNWFHIPEYPDALLLQNEFLPALALT